jgi:glycosyltransferase involved in cell wall biosynthesis
VRPSHQPLVSIITPVYNGGSYLAECIESVLAQTYSRWEYLILDNQSTDSTPEIARSYAMRDERIRVVRTERFVDVIENHNIACRSIPAEASYVKFVHADDWLFPRCIEEMVRVAEAHPRVGIVSAYRLDRGEVTLTGLPHQQEAFPGAEICRRALLERLSVFGSPSSLLLRAEIVRSRDPYFDGEHFFTHADTASCYAVLRAWDLGFVHQVLTFTRRHDHSQGAASRPLNTIIAANLRMVEHFGPHFLTTQEYSELLDDRVRAYHAYLARCTVHWKEPEFWRFHRRNLRDVGHRLSYLRVARAVIGELLETSPAELGRKVSRFVRRTRNRRHALEVPAGIERARS